MAPETVVLYLSDADVLINAARDFYPLDRVPEFWDWLDSYMDDGQGDQIKTIREVLDEATISPGPREVISAKWLRSRAGKLVIPGPSPVDVQRVWKDGYEQVGSLERVSTDALLIATAAANPAGRTVVTMENAQRDRRRGRNRHIPHVCRIVGVPCVDLFELIRRLEFRTAEGRRRAQLQQP